MARTRPVIAWVRRIHRWISLAFTAVAAVVIFGGAPAGTPFGDTLAGIAIALLLLLLISGLWMAIHHYTVAVRRRRRAPGAAAV
ncbi:MAG: hypothetical protein DI566_04920 [Microbacterium sp.]|nr:MAG: hypothetical protein DI566_04920 [Microbacterium sp.]